LEKETQKEGFWDDHQKAASITSELDANPGGGSIKLPSLIIVKI